MSDQSDQPLTFLDMVATIAVLFLLDGLVIGVLLTWSTHERPAAPLLTFVLAPLVTLLTLALSIFQLYYYKHRM